MARKKRRAKSRASRAATREPGRDWARLAGEAALILVVLAVPLLINPRSKQILDVKDLALATGVTLGLYFVLITSLARGRISWVTSRLNVLVVGFLAWAVLSVIYSQYRYATISEAARLAGNVGVYCLVILCVREAGQVRRLLGAAAVAGLAVAVYAFIQQYGVDFWQWKQVAGTRFTFLGLNLWKWEAGTARVFSFLGNATYLASYTVLLAPLLVAVAWPRRGNAADTSGSDRGSLRSPVFSVILFLVAGALMLTLYFTVSLSPMIGLALGALLALLFALVRLPGRALLRVAPWFILTVIVLGVLGVVGYRHLPDRQQRRVQSIIRLEDPDSAERRLQWRTGLDLFREHPVLGSGYGTFRIYSLERMAAAWYVDLRKSPDTMFVPSYAHNEYIQVLAGTGLVGGVLFGALFLGFLGAAARVALRHPEPQWRRLGLATTAAMTAFLFQNFFGVTFRQPGAVTFFWLALGLVTISVARMPRAGQETVEQPRTRDLRFRGMSGGSLAGWAAALLVVVVLIGWLTVRPVRANLMIKQAEVLSKMGQYAKAARLADQAARLNPWDLSTYYISAYAWGSLGDHEKAVAANRRALDLLPGNASVYYNLGVSYAALGRLEEARESFERAVELMPTKDLHHAGLAEVLLKQQNYDEALEHAEKAIELSNRNPKAYALAADIEAKRGNPQGAAEYLRRAIKVAPEEVVLRKDLADILMLAGEDQEALGACQEWVKLQPGSLEPNAALAQLLIRRNEHDRALQFVRNAFAAANADPRLYLLAADIEGTRGRLGQAEGYLRQGTERFPREVRLWRALADNLMRQRKTKDALVAARMWLELEPDASTAYSLIGACQYAQGEYRSARTNLKKALELEPQNDTARLNLAYTYLALGETAQAKAELRQLAARPETAQGKEARRLLAQM